MLESLKFLQPRLQDLFLQIEIIFRSEIERHQTGRDVEKERETSQAKNIRKKKGLVENSYD